VTVKIMFSDIMQCYLAVRYNITVETVASISVVRQQKGAVYYIIQHHILGQQHYILSRGPQDLKSTGVRSPYL
jgi:hypothetical protein